MVTGITFCLYRATSVMTRLLNMQLNTCEKGIAGKTTNTINQLCACLHTPEILQFNHMSLQTQIL